MKAKWITVFELGTEDWIQNGTGKLDALFNFLICSGYQTERVTITKIDVLVHPSNENSIKDLVDAFLSGWEARSDLKDK